jgi:hypothetical protein
MNMARSLGIFVTDTKHVDKIVKLCQAAKKKDVEITIFFSHLGVLLTQDPRFEELAGMGNASVCNVGFESHGLKPPVPGLGEKDYGTQARHGEMIEDCDRYVVF